MAALPTPSANPLAVPLALPPPANVVTLLLETEMARTRLLAESET